MQLKSCSSDYQIAVMHLNDIKGAQCTLNGIDFYGNDLDVLPRYPDDKKNPVSGTENAEECRKLCWKNRINHVNLSPNLGNGHSNFVNDKSKFCYAWSYVETTKMCPEAVSNAICIITMIRILTKTKMNFEINISNR